MQALKSFSRAVHLHPADFELWTDDLLWAVSLLEKKEKLEKQKEEEAQKSSVQITEIDDSESTENSCTDVAVSLHDSTKDFSPGEDQSSSGNDVNYVPRNYVKMRH